ncbi:hypothetical protein Misp03_36990 [Microbispora sp. NBRC 16548]|nr:hypothetical protein Misp03_36990 [Microbispora sp. NBRC 16548]
MYLLYEGPGGDHRRQGTFAEAALLHSLVSSEMPIPPERRAPPRDRDDVTDKNAVSGLDRVD